MPDTPRRQGGIAALVDNHRPFLAFLQSRLGDRAAAEDVLQDAFVRAIPRVNDVEDQAVIPWFYAALRHAVIDRARRRGAEDRALTAFAREVDADVPPPDVRREICACVGRLASTLKPEYAEALSRVDLDDVPVKKWAGEAGLSQTNASVRLHRARLALRRQVAASCGACADHGCVDCTCAKPPRGAPEV